jgi:CheY-like chemotaxis protein
METSLPVLVVEDEQLIHALLTETLTEGGFAVATAADGEEAIRMLEAPDASYRALVTDVNLSPGKLTGGRRTTRT